MLRVCARDASGDRAHSLTTMPRFFLSLVLASALLCAGCSSAYYGAMEKIGFAKREILVDRVADAQKAQSAAKAQFASALERFLAVTQINGGTLQRKYDELNREFARSETRAQEVRTRIAAVEDVAEALFGEWKKELAQYSNAALRTESERQLGATRRRYDDLLHSMRRAADRMDPVLVTFRDQLLFLKHNLNARAIASLDTTTRTLEADISRLIADMETSIRESDAFIKSMKDGG